MTITYMTLDLYCIQGEASCLVKHRPYGYKQVSMGSTKLSSQAEMTYYHSVLREDNPEINCHPLLPTYIISHPHNCLYITSSSFKKKKKEITRTDTLKTIHYRCKYVNTNIVYRFKVPTRNCNFSKRFLLKFVNCKIFVKVYLLSLKLDSLSTREKCEYCTSGPEGLFLNLLESLYK